VAKEFNSIDSLLKGLEKDIAKTLNKTKDTYANEKDNPKYVMMQVIDDVVYKDSNSWYENTFGLRDSVNATRAYRQGDYLAIDLFHDDDLWKANPDKFQHGSNYWGKRKDGSGKDIRDILPDIIQGNREWGTLNGLFPENGKWRTPKPYVDMTADELMAGRLRNWLHKKLTEKGW